MINGCLATTENQVVGRTRYTWLVAAQRQGSVVEGRVADHSWGKAKSLVFVDWTTVGRPAAWLVPGADWPSARVVLAWCLWIGSLALGVHGSSEGIGRGGQRRGSTSPYRVSMRLSWIGMIRETRRLWGRGGAVDLVKPLLEAFYALRVDGSCFVLPTRMLARARHADAWIEGFRRDCLRPRLSAYYTTVHHTSTSQI